MRSNGKKNLKKNEFRSWYYVGEVKTQHNKKGE